MKIHDIYKNLKDVKIFDATEKKQHSFLFYWFEDEDEEDINKNWVAIFHNKYKKYLVTNDINICGLNEDTKNIEIIGFASNLDYMMFVIYEHQKARGLEITIEDEIKELILKEKKKLANNEWNWAKPSDKNTIEVKRFFTNS